MERIDQLVLGRAGVNGDALDAYGGAVGREGLIDDLAQLAAIEGVGKIGGQILGQVGMDAATDLFVGREADA